jgi:hypothetical protein
MRILGLSLEFTFDFAHLIPPFTSPFSDARAVPTVSRLAAREFLKWEFREKVENQSSGRQIAPK